MPNLKLVADNVCYYDVYERDDEDLRVVGCLQAIDAHSALLAFRDKYGNTHDQLVVLPTLGLGDRYFD